MTTAMQRNSRQHAKDVRKLKRIEKYGSRAVKVRIRRMHRAGTNPGSILLNVKAAMSVGHWIPLCLPAKPFTVTVID